MDKLTPERVTTWCWLLGVPALTPEMVVALERPVRRCTCQPYSLGPAGRDPLCEVHGRKGRRS